MDFRDLRNKLKPSERGPDVLMLRFGAELEPREWLREGGQGGGRGRGEKPGDTRNAVGRTGPPRREAPVNQEEAGACSGRKGPPIRAEATGPVVLRGDQLSHTHTPQSLPQVKDSEPQGWAGVLGCVPLPGPVRNPIFRESLGSPCRGNWWEIRKGPK